MLLDCQSVASLSTLTQVDSSIQYKVHMIEIEDFKKALGEKAEHMSLQDIEKLKNWQYKLANVLFDVWNKNEKKQKIGTIVIVHKENGHLINCWDFGEISYA